MDADQIRNLVVIITLIFLLAPGFLILYIIVYNGRKKRHIQEKEQMKVAFNAEITKAQLEVQEQTMQTIGAELHDNIGQLLSLTSLTLNSVELDEPGKAHLKINAAIDLTLRSIKELRQLGHLLQGDQLVSLGLTEAIKQEANWMERSGKYEIVYSCSNELPAQGNKDKDLIIFRILQEILNNIIKHASATAIQLRLDFDEGLLKLQVSDNGVGFDPQNLSQAPGIGLYNIRKRATLVGGEAHITSSPGLGSEIVISIPYP